MSKSIVSSSYTSSFIQRQAAEDARRLTEEKVRKANVKLHVSIWKQDLDLFNQAIEEGGNIKASYNAGHMLLLANRYYSELDESTIRKFSYYYPNNGFNALEATIKITHWQSHVNGIFQYDGDVGKTKLKNIDQILKKLISSNNVELPKNIFNLEEYFPESHRYLMVHNNDYAQEKLKSILSSIFLPHQRENYCIKFFEEIKKTLAASSNADQKSFLRKLAREGIKSMKKYNEDIRVIDIANNLKNIAVKGDGKNYLDSFALCKNLEEQLNLPLDVLDIIGEAIA